MATTTIALTQPAYERLKKQKLPGESFSDVVLREIPVPCETRRRSPGYFDTHPVPKADPQRRAELLAGRGRLSPRKTPPQPAAAHDCGHDIFKRFPPRARGGPARPGRAFPRRRRAARLLVTVISAGEIAVLFDSGPVAREFLGPFRLLRLTPEIASAAAQIDREQIAAGARLGENDNWIAGFCRYYGQPLISRDRAFDSVRGLRRLAY